MQRAILSRPRLPGNWRPRGGYTMSLSRACPVNSTAGSSDLRRDPPRQINMTQLARVLTEPQTPPITTLFVYNSNPVAMNPDQNRLIRGLRRDDLFTIVHDQVMTDTALFADVVLPATTFLEQNELKRAYGHHYLQWAEAVIDPVGEAVSNVELFARLARVMGFDESEVAPGEESLMTAALDCDRERLGGVSPEDLRRDRIARVRFDGDRGLIQFGTDFPTTPERRAQLAPPQLGPISYRPARHQAYPLILLSPATDRTINSTLGEFNLLSPKLSMSAADAAARGIRDGDIVRAFNDLGEVHVPAKVADTIRSGVVSLPKGMWCDSSLNRSTVTALVPDDLTDIGDGACFNDARVEVARLEM
jgi:anaerobic selenocysteine-containing dehydrogenase